MATSPCLNRFPFSHIHCNDWIDRPIGHTFFHFLNPEPDLDRAIGIRSFYLIRFPDNCFDSSRIYTFEDPQKNTRCVCVYKVVVEFQNTDRRNRHFFEFMPEDLCFWEQTFEVEDKYDRKVPQVFDLASLCRELDTEYHTDEPELFPVESYQEFQERVKFDPSKIEE